MRNWQRGLLPSSRPFLVVSRRVEEISYHATRVPCGRGADPLIFLAALREHALWRRSVVRIAALMYTSGALFIFPIFGLVRRVPSV